MTRNELYLIRHGETEWSRSGAHTGRTDIPLTPEGELRAALVGNYLRNQTFALVLSSPLKRAFDTCRLAGYGEQAQVIDDLREWDYGAYEGRATPDIQSIRPGWSLWRDGVEAGETVEQVGERARRVIAIAAEAEGNVVLFAHGHILRILAACWVGLEPESGRALVLGTSSVSVLGYERDTRAIIRWNLDVCSGATL